MSESSHEEGVAAERLAHAAPALGVELDAASQQRLLDYLTLLKRWNKTYNLTAVRDTAAMLSQHLFDCLAVVPSLRRGVPPGPLRVLDVGSGGGLPGVVLAVLQPEWQVSCVDAVGKKAAFIRQVAAELRLPNLISHHARVESLDGQHHLIVSRAFSSLPLFTATTQRLLAPGGRWCAMKGKLPQDEIDSLPAAVHVFHVEHLQVPDLVGERCLVWMQPAGALSA